MNKIVLFFAIIFSVIFVTNCAIKTNPFTAQQIDNFARDKYQRATKNQVPIKNKVTLYEAMARAIKYSLDYRVETINHLLAKKNLSLAKAEALPDIVANGGWAYRNNSSASDTSGVGRTGVTSSQDDGAFIGDITFTWHILDFGLSYIRAKQSADEVLIARERRRRVIHKTIEDVRTAYWRAVSAQRLMDGFTKLKAQTEQALQQSKKLYATQESSPISALTFQRELVDIKKQIYRIQQELKTAKIQLNALMNVRPGTKYELHMPERNLNSLTMNKSIENMVQSALRNRPELLEIGYQQRINEKEIKSALLEIFPSISTTVGVHQNQNRFLVNSDWVSHGAQVGWNLMRAFSYPSRAEAIKTRSELLDSRALATSMAIMTQVHVAHARYEYIYNSAKVAKEYYEIQQNIEKQTQALVSAKVAAPQMLIKEKLNTLVAAAQYDLVHGELQNAYGAIYTSIGANPYDVKISDNMTIPHLTKILQKTWEKR